MTDQQQPAARRWASFHEMPAGLSLPSGRKIPTYGLQAWPIGPDGHCEIGWSHVTETFRLDPHDAAALHAALSRFGYEADAPTLKGDDRDADGLRGE